MFLRISSKYLLTFILLLSSVSFFGQEKEIRKLTPFLSRTYYNFNFGGIFYNYSDANLPSGYVSESTQKNWFSGRILLGYKIKKDLALQYGVMRPADWFKFDNINNIGYERSVWFNLWSLSLKKSFRINNKISFYSELGIANVSRVGFSIDNQEVYKDAHYTSIISGIGFSYQLNKNWDLLLNTTYVPKSTENNQPAVFQSSIGMLYNLKRNFENKEEKKLEESTYFFPKQILQFSYGTSNFGFFANEFFSMSAKIGSTENIGIPVFWLGEVKAAKSFSVTYQKTAFRTEKLFSLDWGVSITGFQTTQQTTVYAFSIFPLMRFYVFRPKPFDLYLNYSVIGPTFLTKSNVDGFRTGPKITYQDFMGVGAFFGKKRTYNFELRITHYSNGNFFPENDGIDLPLQITFGKTF